MTYKHVPIYDSSVNFEQLLNHKAINYFMQECGGYIAGGLAEKEFNHYNIGNYLKTDLSQYNGDVDIYFETQDGLNKAIDYAYDISHTCRFKELDGGFPTHDLSTFSDFSISMMYTNAPGKYVPLSETIRGV